MVFKKEESRNSFFCCNFAAKGNSAPCLTIISAMKKYCKDLRVSSVEQLHERYVLLKLTDDEPLPDCLPGQFVEVKVDHSPNTYLRRPISVCFVDKEKNEMWLLIATIGEGTRTLAECKEGEKVNCVFPLGNSFSLPATPQERHLLIGGGVGMAPMFMLGAKIKEMEGIPTFLLGARSAKDVLLADIFARYGTVYITTEDGSLGEKGYVTQHSILGKEHFDKIATCGPKPMMMAVADYARKADTECEVSLENLMACGIGACLCCVEKTTEGNLCACTEGPVFNTKKLLWQH